MNKYGDDNNYSGINYPLFIYLVNHPIGKKKQIRKIY